MPRPVLHETFRDHVRARGDAMAVACEGETLTYAQLDLRATRIACALVDLGVKGTAPVAVLADRGPDLVAALLGVLTAGSAFVCLNPAHPPERLGLALSELSPEAVVADGPSWSRHAALLDRAVGDAGVIVAGENLERYGHSAPGVEVSAGDLAYIAYTSGSTGRPKGIPHIHATLSQFVAWQGEAFRIDGASRVAQLAQPTFDVSYCEIFGALCRGASLHIVPDAIRNDPSALDAWLRTERISLLQIVPPHWQAVLASLPPSQDHPLPDLRTIVFVGEALSAGLTAQTRARMPRAPDLYNVYGPTEVVAATYHKVEGLDPGLPTVPIGKEIPGRQILLTNVEPGQAGEIYIRSPYLAKGYLNQDHETRVCFVQNPTHADYPDIVYRTGDLARRLPSGELVFAGRRDNQVKILGQRVELEEVEAAIVGTGDVTEAGATLARGEAEASRVLIAHVVPRGDLDPAMLRGKLEAVLPRYMVPAVLVPTAQLPRNAHGKLDRAALRDLPVPATTSEQAGAPVGEVEGAIAEIWRDLLGLAQVGRHDDLFALGADSLLATRLISRVRARLGVRVTLRSLFETPTIAGLAMATSSAPADTLPLRRRTVAS